MKLFIDSSAYIAFYNERDEKHREAEKFIEEIKNGVFGPVIFYTTDYIFDEVVTSILLLTKRKDLAIKVGEAIISSKVTRIVKVDDTTFKNAWDMFIKFKDKLWSFTDCTSFALMKRYKLATAFTFDEHYRQAGFKTLP
ncbi:type II toxin-antitoxin system VapC family toxin [Candidatus Bathyarchaeota archaeon]|nr:type II toxin-antitoxin system VapC family toxin [Candidatus Bathyarchaeota archaeon]